MTGGGGGVGQHGRAPQGAGGAARRGRRPRAARLAARRPGVTLSNNGKQCYQTIANSAIKQ
jgi:hypothetical protein